MSDEHKTEAGKLVSMDGPNFEQLIRQWKSEQEQWIESSPMYIFIGRTIAALQFSQSQADEIERLEEARSAYGWVRVEDMAISILEDEDNCFDIIWECPVFGSLHRDIECTYQDGVFEDDIGGMFSGVVRYVCVSDMSYEDLPLPSPPQAETG